MEYESCGSNPAYKNVIGFWHNHNQGLCELSDSDMFAFGGDYYKYGIAWLDVSNAVLVVPGSENSKGTQKEIERAKELRIPVFYNLKDLEEHFGS